MTNPEESEPVSTRGPRALLIAVVYVVVAFAACGLGLLLKNDSIWALMAGIFLLAGGIAGAIVASSSVKSPWWLELWSLAAWVGVVFGGLMGVIAVLF